MQIGLLGYGTVGGGVDVLANGKNGMTVTKVLCLGPQDMLNGRGVQSIDEIVNDPAIDTVVEAMGGLHPAWEYASAALKAGKNYVTANKALVAAYLPQLLELSQTYGSALRCTAAVGGGIPWLVNLERCRRLDSVYRLWGIFNGTTNFILDAMTTKGADFGAVLQEAQSLGYAEADPTADIDGWDVRRKLMISMAAAFDAVVPEESIPMFGIRNITAKDVANFKAMGRVCKLIAEGAATDQGVTASVEPLLLPTDAPEAAVPANYNLVAYESDNAGWQSFFGQGAGRYPTAYNVVQDCLDLQNGVTSFYAKAPQASQVDDRGLFRRYYVRTAEADAWLNSVTETKENGYCITKAIPQQELHRWAAKQLTVDPGLFLAGLK